MNFGGFGALPAVSPYIGAQAGGNDLAIGPGYAAYPAANATAPNVTKTLLSPKLTTKRNLPQANGQKREPS